MQNSWQYRLLFSFLVALVMSIFIGGVISLVRNGVDGWWSAFIGTVPLAFVVAFPTSLFVVPLVQQLTDSLLGVLDEDN